MTGEPDYDPDAYPPFAVTVDLVVLTVSAAALQEQALRALVIRRGEPPFRGRQALPGGFVREREDLADAARRELAEETGVRAVPGHLEQLASYGAPDRDPRMRVVSVAYLMLASDLPLPVAGSDAAAAAWLPVTDLLAHPRRMAFDHARILADGVERARAKLEYTTLATTFCPPEFTIAELRAVYEAVWDEPLDPRNFHRKVTGSAGFVESTGTVSGRGGGRPAELFRAGPATSLHPPLLRG